MADDNNNPDQGFNDDELQDIMNEIESLEKEFVEDEAAEEVVAEAEEVPAEPVASEPTPTPVAEENNVVDMGPAKPASAPSVGTGSQMSFQGEGQLNFNMSFDVAGKSAHLTVDPGQGLKVTLNGVELSITEAGCSVNMEGGVTFSVPFDATKSGQKAA